MRETQESDMGRLLTTLELASYLGMKEQTLRKWRHGSIGPTYVKLGHQIRYRRSDVDGWLQANASLAIRQEAGK